MLNHRSHFIKKIFIIFCLLFLQLSHASWPHKKKDLIIPSQENILHRFDLSSYQALESTIDLLVWNVHKENLTQNWKQEFSSLPASHIYLFQEILQPFTRPDQRESNLISWHLKFYDNVMATSFINDDDMVHTGLQIASYSHLSRLGFTQTSEREPLINTPKLNLYSQLVLHDYKTGFSTMLLVLNIHALNFTSFQDFVSQIDPALKVIDEHSSLFHGPIIFAGDFNTWSKRRIQYLDDTLIKSRGFQEIHFESDIRKTFRGYPLDHIFIKNLKPLHSQVYQVQHSDHNPMSTRLQWIP